MADAPKARAPRKRAAPKPVPAVEQMTPEVIAPEPTLSITDVRARAEHLQAGRDEMVKLEAQLVAKLDETRSSIKAHDGALEVCVGFINQLKMAGAA